MKARSEAVALGRLADLLLTTDRVKRVRLLQCSLAVSLMTMGAAIMNYGVWAGVVQPAWVSLWTTVSVGGMLLAYVFIRSGMSARFSDPSLTGFQTGFAIVCGAVAYGLAGPLRGAVFPVLMTVLVFTMFQMRLRNTVFLSFYALLLFTVVMAVMVKLRPDVYVPAVELGHFLMLLATLPVISLLAGRLSQIRHRLARQKEELAEALGKIQVLATHDDLTGLFNRRHMQSLLEMEVQRNLRSGNSFCVGLFDIDYFKRVNDLYGHGAGDEVLRAFAQVCLGALRGSDLLARWGGEEFVAVLPNTNLPLALAGIERLRELVQQHEVLVAGVELSVTFSAGLTEHRPDETLAQTIERADRLLYEAKKRGRNRVVAD